MANAQIINRLVKTLKQVNGLSEDLIFIVDRRHIIQYVGGNLARRSRCREKAIGSSIVKTFPDSCRLLKPAIQRVFDSGRHVSLENALTLGTEELWFDTRLSPVLDELGTSIAVMAACRDVTKRKQNEELLIRSKQGWLRAVDNMPYLLAVVDSGYRVERVNAAMARKLNISVNRARGLICYENLHGMTEPPDFCPLVNQLKRGAEYRAETTEKHLGHDYFVTVSSLKDHHGNPSGCVYMARGCHDAQPAVNGRERNLERMRTLRKQAQYIVTVQNPQGEYIFFKSIPENGLVAENFIGKTPVDFFEPRTASKLMVRLQEAVEGGRDWAQANVFSWDGETVRFMDQLAPIKDRSGEIKAVVTFSTRIDEPKMGVGREQGHESSEQAALTKRECEILRLIATGHTNQQIAENLFISKKTVDTHRSRIMQKLDVHKASALVRYAVESRML